MSAIIRNGWEIYFHRNFFGEHRRQLKEQVRQLKENLPPEEFVKHPTVKLLAAVMVGIKEKIGSRSVCSSICSQGCAKALRKVEGNGIKRSLSALFSCF